MPLLCPTCSRANPADATYCYYDGRGLNKTALAGPLGSGTTTFPLPFSFADGLGCSTFNQLVLASDQRWIEARTYLFNGTWQTFFTAIGRVDLAILARQSAAHPDPDLGLCQFLERLPADAEALRLPKLALPSTEENLGILEPGMDHKVPLVIANEGMLLLCGAATTDCDWLALGSIHESGTAKLFQTRDAYTLPVRVVGSKLRAAKQPLEGHILIETNGGRQTVTVRAHVPIRPFPAGPDGKNVLTGALSSREIAIRAKAHPQEAVTLFEQGAVKAWYQSNGWAYPIRGSQATGKSALQQFFEALGLARPPRLEIDTEQIACQGAIGQQLTKKVILRTAEPRFVHAEAHSSQSWIKVLPGVSHGNSYTIPLCLEVPPRAGEILHAAVTFRGNGQQQFVVPVALTVTAKTPEQEEEDRVRRRMWLTWGISGVVILVALIIAIRLIIDHRRSLSKQNGPADRQAFSDLALVPADAQGFVSVRVADVWKTDLVQQGIFLAQQKKPGLDVQKEIVDKLELSPADIERVTFVIPDLQHEEGWFIVSASRPLNQQQLIGKWLSGARSEQHEGKSYQVGLFEGKPLAVSFVSDRIFLLGTEKELKKGISAANTPRKTGPLQASLQLAAGTHHLVAALAPPPQMMWKVARENRKMESLADLERTSLILDVGATAEMTLQGVFTSDARAAKASTWVKDLVAQTKTILPLFKPQISDNHLYAQIETMMNTIRVEPKGKELTLGAKISLTRWDLDTILELMRKF